MNSDQCGDEADRPVGELERYAIDHALRAAWVSEWWNPFDPDFGYTDYFEAITARNLSLLHGFEELAEDAERRGVLPQSDDDQTKLVTDGGRDQSGRTDRCGVCGERVAGVVDALEHYLVQHPHSDLLHDTLSEVFVRSECAECGDAFTTVVSVGIDAKPDTATLTVPSYCGECVDSDPISGLIVKEMAPDKVLSREIPSDA